MAVEDRTSSEMAMVKYNHPPGLVSPDGKDFPSYISQQKKNYFLKYNTKKFDWNSGISGTGWYRIGQNFIYILKAILPYPILPCT